MFFAPNPGILASGSTGKTYAEFEARMNAIAVDGGVAWDATTPWPSSGMFTTTAATATGGMLGSSWSARFRGGGGAEGAPARVVQHALLSESVFNDQVSFGRVIFLQINSPSAGPSFVGVNRNGYTSNSSGSTTQPRQCIKIIRWDGSRAWESNPSIGGPETEYTW